MEQRNIIVLKYIFILAGALTLGLTWKEVTYTGGILFLIFVLLVQLRQFYLKEEKANRLALVLEVILAIPLIYFTGGVPFPILGLTAMEISLEANRTLSSSLFAILLGATFLLLPKVNSVTWLHDVLFVTLCYVAFRVLMEEFSRKIKAQNLYDELHQSQKKLSEAYKELEFYADSIEEVTLLRERNRISRDIHDSVGHDLSTILIQLGALERLTKDDDRLAPLVHRLHDFSKESLGHVRAAVRGLKPSHYNLDPIIMIQNLLHQHKRMTGTDSNMSLSKNNWHLSEDQGAVLYRAVQEFLANANKYSKATLIRLVISFSEDEVLVSLADNGVGAEKVVKGFGLTSMTERVEELGGKLTLWTAPGEGYKAKIILPRVEKYKLGGIHGEN